MKINLPLLRSLVPFPGDGHALADLLETVGFEIDRVEATPAGDVLEFDITPNRPDWLCHLGVAREVAAKMPQFALQPPRGAELPATRLDPSFPVRIEALEGCPRYCGALVTGVRVQDSPPEVAALLESLGLRPINNLVDISNLVMMTLGQPVHFFDADRLAGPAVIVRRARAGERIVLLDGREPLLHDSDLVIADSEKPIALAGIMGGQDSAITGATRSLFIESAWFAWRGIRRTARRHGLRSDASYRYERGTDPALPPLSLAYALALLERITGEKPTLALFTDAGDVAGAQPAIELAKEFPSVYSGMPLTGDECAGTLLRLGFTVEERSGDWRVTPPSFRVDVAGREDLVEEIVREVGFDRLPSVLPVGVRQAVDVSPHRLVRELARDHLIYGGWHEAMNWSFQSPGENSLFSSDGTDVVLKNPLGREYSVMRGSLLPGLLRNAALNLNAGETRLALFETGHVFAARDGEIVETDRLALLQSGLEMRPSWRTVAREGDLFTLKAAVQALCGRLGRPVEFAPAPVPGTRPGHALLIEQPQAEEGALGWIGEVDLPVLARFAIERAVFAVELDLHRLCAPVAGKPFAPWNRLPAAVRDFSFLMPQQLLWGDFCRRTDALRPVELEQYKLVDLYRGESLPPGTVSMTVGFSYRSAGGTLSGEQITEIHTRLTGRLTADLGLLPRSTQGVKP